MDEEDTQARLIAAEVHGVHVISAYVPNGQSVGSEKWFYKLRWLEQLREHLDRRFKPSDPLVLCGDFDVAIDDSDVADPARRAGTVLCHQQARH
jgi:exodeoxyribonuclease-3